MSSDKFIGIVTKLRVIQTANKSEIAFFDFSEKKMVIFPKLYSDFKKVIKNGTTLTIYARKDLKRENELYIVEDVFSEE